MSPTELTTLPQVHLSPGELVITCESQIVVTVLGSCVAVTMFDRASGLAAICHAMLAHPQTSALVPPGDPHRFRYVSHAVPAMAAAYRRARVDARTIEVKLFGGGNVLGHAVTGFGGGLVGATNLETARDILQCANLVVSAENTGGRCGRKILFNTATGEVLHKQLHHGAP